MNFILLFSLVLSFLVTLTLTPLWIKRAQKAGLVGPDVHKVGHPKIAEMGGLTVMMGFCAGVLSFVAIRTFFFQSYGTSLQIMTILASMLIITLIGIMDDVLGWKIGIRQRHKPLLTLAAAIPMVVLNAGHHIMHLPLFGDVNFGILYPLFIVPIAIVGASNGFNMVGGYNGLEAGLGAIILGTMGFFAWRTGDSWSAMIMFCMVFSLLAFYYFNSHPAKIFPGDTLTYAVGALIAMMAIMANMEKVAIILFIPFFLQFLLKLRGKMKKESFARLNGEGSLSLNYKSRIYGIEHLAIRILSIFKKKVFEKDVVYSLFFFELILSLIVLIPVL